MVGIAVVLSTMTHNYNNSAKKDSVVTSLFKIWNIITKLNNVKDKIINLKKTVTKRFQED